MMKMIRNLLSTILIIHLARIRATKFPNDILDSPSIECNQDSISIKVKTSNMVASRMYAKEHADDPKCNFRSVNNATFILTDCGMNRQRQLQPRGLTYSLVVVVQLHPMFITKVDRAYNLKCFYTEAAKTVTAALDVSMLQTDNINGSSVSGGGAMPVCNYTLRLGTPSGQLVRYARIGDMVWHLWECASEEFGMLIHSCFVTDGQGNEFQVLDRRGCGIDEYVLKTPSYSVDLNKAQQETHVFKFADKTVVLFNCQVKLCPKANDGCKRITPPDCSNTTAVTSERLEVSTIKSNESNPIEETTNTKTTKGAGGNHTIGENIDEPASTKSLDTTTIKSAENNERTTSTSIEKNSTAATSETPSNETTSNEMHVTNETSTAGETGKGETSGVTETTKMPYNHPENATEHKETLAAKDAEPRANQTGEYKNTTIREDASTTEQPAHNKTDPFDDVTTRGTTGAGQETKGHTEAGKEKNETMRLRRSTFDEASYHDASSVDDLETDVAQRIWVLEPDETTQIDNDRSKSTWIGLDDLQEKELSGDARYQQVCLSSSKFATLISFLVLFILIVSILIICLLIARRRRRQCCSSSSAEYFPGSSSSSPPSSFRM